VEGVQDEEGKTACSDIAIVVDGYDNIWMQRDACAVIFIKKSLYTYFLYECDHNKADVQYDAERAGSKRDNG
jgi:hypothetical protein